MEATAARLVMRASAEQSDAVVVEAPNFVSPSAAAIAAQIAVDLVDQGLSTAACNELLRHVGRLTIDVGSPYFMNQLFAGIRPEVIAAETLLATVKTTMATFEASGVFAVIEHQVVRAVGRLVGWQDSTVEGLAVPGGSAANFMALHCARQAYNPEAKRYGNGNHRFVIFVSAAAHYSWNKAAVVLGFGTDAVVPVRTDAQGRMLATELALAIASTRLAGHTPLLVAATAGTTVYGAFDPLAELVEQCAAERLWLHIDAAWGGPVLFSSRYRRLMAAAEAADSLTFDAHKLCGASLTSAFFVTQRQGILRAANDVGGGSYLFHGDGEGLGDSGPLSWQCGRRADSLVFWVVWKRLGSAGLASLVDRLMQLRQDFVAWLPTQDRVVLMHDPVFLNVCLRICPPAGQMHLWQSWSQKVRQDLLERNLAMVNFAVDADGTTFLRLVLVHPELTMEHLEKIVEWALGVV